MDTIELTKLHEDGTSARAIFSRDMQYRYYLSRIWDTKRKPLVGILPNPSTGDHISLETTTKGFQTRAKSWEYGGIVVLNLFAYISTDPTKLKHVADPVGSLNDAFLLSLNDKCEEVVCAWGNQGALHNRAQKVLNLLKMPLYTFGLTKSDQPRHPLHMSYQIKPTLFRNCS